MNAFFPILVNPQAVPNAIGRGETVTEPLAQVSRDESSTSGQTFSPVFAQILDDVTSDRVLTQKDLSNLEVLSGSDSNGNVLRETQDFAVQASLPVAIPTVPLVPLKGTQTLTNEFLQSQAFQPTSGEPIPGSARPAFEIEGNYSGNPQASVPKVLETGPVSHQVPLLKVLEGGVASQQVPQGPEGKLDSSVLKQEDGQGTPRIAPSAKEIPSGLQQVSRFIQEDESLKLPILPRPTNSPNGSQNLRPNNVLPVPAVQPEAPAGFSQALSTGPLAIKPIPGTFSVVHDMSNPVIGLRTTIPVDLLGESGLLGKGDRAQAMVETSVKSAGLDVSGGQGLGSGMNHFQNPQSGFQQPSATLGQGVSLRGLEERSPEFPAPVLQRLQMDVQLSETQRVSIDVGVQNRLVSAGLVMDQAVLRNLANQFVPQLENQLADLDMELQEFSAQVREERDQKDDTLFNDSRYHTAPKSERGSQAELSSPQNFRNRQGEHGLHLVA